MKLYADVHKHAKGVEVYISIGRSNCGGGGESSGHQGCELPCQSDFVHTDAVSVKVLPNNRF